MSRNGWTLTLGALALLACAGPDAAPSQAEQPAVKDTSYAATVRTDRTRYSRGEPITITIVLRNTSSAPQTLEFSSSQRYDFAIEDTRAPLWRWSAAVMFAQVLGEETIAPGDSLSYSEMFRGELPAGSYRAIGWITRMGAELKATAEFEIH